jgi:DNA polymerase I-like protein with 3'-5' exonuclease and polymerase domains
MQNLPGEMLRFLCADEGFVLYNLDLSQAENRIVAYIAPEPAMIHAFESKIDIHSQTGSLIFGDPIDVIRQEDKDEVQCALGDGVHTKRFWGKKSNHSFNYDLGYKAFAYLMEMEEKESKWIIERYHHVYPGVRQYHAWVRAALQKNRTLENLMGRRRTFMDRWGDDLFKESYAQIPQSTVADIINRRGINYLYYGQEHFKPVDILDQVHDAIVLQMSYVQYTWTQHADCLMRLKDSLEQPLIWKGTQFVIPADVKMGLTLNKKSMREVKINEYSSAAELGRCLAENYEVIHNEQSEGELHLVEGDSSEEWLWNSMEESEANIGT